ncbi:MAG: hypothetical protein VX034_09505, partial [Planctomycetota bacterium]|nr:hypothetical protein [Planctomycetota bacterium]
VVTNGNIVETRLKSPLLKKLNPLFESRSADPTDMDWNHPFRKQGFANRNNLPICKARKFGELGEYAMEFAD